MLFKNFKKMCDLQKMKTWKFPGLETRKDLARNRVGKVGPKFRMISKKSRNGLKEVVA